MELYIAVGSGDERKSCMGPEPEASGMPVLKPWIISRRLGVRRG